MTMTFTEPELGVISNALRVAAERFQERVGELQAHYGNLVGVGAEVMGGLVSQFTMQADAARKLYDTIAEGTGIAA
jgi:hypothetical protein